jgi:RimJ/RimL family protein N-acetyltransferase
MKTKLVKLTNKYSDALMELLTPSITRWLEPISYPLKDKDKINWLNKMKKQKSFAIIVNNKVTGMIWFENFNRAKRCAEIGLFLGDEYRGKGYAKEAVKKVIGYGFEKLKLEKIVALTNNFNKHSQKLLKKNCFVLTKRIKRDYREKFSGRWCDVLIYEIKNRSKIKK